VDDGRRTVKMVVRDAASRRGPWPAKEIDPGGAEGASSRAMSPSQRPTAILPGLALAVLTAVIARGLHELLPRQAQHLVAEVIVAVLLGLIAGNALRLPAIFAPGVRFSYQTVLRAAIILLGASLSFQQVLRIGGKALLMIAALMTVALLVAHALGRLARVSSRLATLIGVGTAVCGNSAIAATAPVIGAADEEVSFAIAANTLFGTVAVFLYPALGHLLGLSSSVFGTWVGMAVNDTSQVVATGFAYGEAAGKVATAVKLTRNALMGVVIVVVGVLHGRSPAGAAGAAATPDAARVPIWKRAQQSVPIFVLGFLAMAALNSMGVFAQLTEVSGHSVPEALQACSRVLILVALAGVGLSARVATMRAIGLKPFYIGLATSATTATLGFLLIRALGPASG
jgi:uncharacterized integral membrane protein (TIGR00698 family)